MAAVTSEMVKALREKTGARMLDCQKALVECKGSVEEAVSWLRKKNLAAGESAKSRTAEEGLLGVRVSADGRAISCVELSANTDFVTRNDEFRKLLASLCEVCDAQKVDSAPALLQQPLGGRKVADVVQELAGKIGENVAVRRVARLEGEVGYYLHHDGKQVAVVEVTGITGEKAVALAKDLSMHVVFAKPAYLRRDEVPAELVAKEKDIAAERLKNDPKNANKPPQILAKIAEGQLGKFFATTCLLDQPYYRENAKTVTQVLKEQGGTATVKRFVFLKVGA